MVGAAGVAVAALLALAGQLAAQLLVVVVAPGAGNASSVEVVLVGPAGNITLAPAAAGNVSVVVAPLDPGLLEGNWTLVVLVGGEVAAAVPLEAPGRGPARWELLLQLAVGLLVVAVALLAYLAVRVRERLEVLG